VAIGGIATRASSEMQLDVREVLSIAHRPRGSSGGILLGCAGGAVTGLPALGRLQGTAFGLALGVGHALDIYGLGVPDTAASRK